MSYLFSDIIIYSMKDSDLIAKLSQLRQEKPREEWVVLTRQRLFEAEAQYGLPPLQGRRLWGILQRIGRLIEFTAQYAQRPALVIPVLAVIVAGGAIGRGTLESLPGDTFYPLRVAVEQVPLRFSAAEERPVREFGLARQRLSDLRMVAESNSLKNLPAAIEEFETNASKVSAEFIEIVENQPENALQTSRQIVQLQKEKSEVEEILGTKIGEEQNKGIEDAIRVLVEYEVAYLETRSLTEEQEQLFESVKALIEEEDYATALETIWTLSQDN